MKKERCKAVYKGHVDDLTKKFIWARLARGKQEFDFKIPRKLLNDKDNKAVDKGSYLTVRVFKDTSEVKLQWMTKAQTKKYFKQLRQIQDGFSLKELDASNGL